LPAYCNISNELVDRVAKPFNYPMSSSADKKTHSKTINQNNCANRGGDLCYINNDDITLNGVYHRYTIRCSPDDSIEVNSSTKEICFGVRTWYQIGQTQYNGNICNGSIGCSGTFPQPCQGACTPNCAGKQCGDNGCGGSCGTCTEGAVCNQNGQCVAGCIPNCAGKQCGDNGCGGSCGACAPEQTCQNGQCVFGCTPTNCQVLGKQCGQWSNGCGAILDCGTCSVGQICQNGQCIQTQGGPGGEHD